MDEETVLRAVSIISTGQPGGCERWVDWLMAEVLHDGQQQQHQQQQQQPQQQQQQEGESLERDTRSGSFLLRANVGLRREVFQILATQFLTEINQICAAEKRPPESGGREDDGPAETSSSLLSYLTTGTVPPKDQSLLSAVLWIRITLMGIRMQIRIRLITLMRIRIRLFNLISDPDPNPSFQIKAQTH
jgi:hypothetical protein